ncbi:hypothetical protein GCM10020220_054600 [Nonomuraea rubra]
MDGEIIVGIPPGTAADEGPVYERPFHEPAGQAALNSDTPPTGWSGPPTCGRPCSSCSAPPNLASKAWVTDQYDRYVRSNTVLAQPADAGMLRISEAIEGPSRPPGASRCPPSGNGRYAKLDPYAGAQLRAAEAYRNVAVTGAKPLAVTNCLNFGSPEDPRGVMWQFAEATRGLADACRALGVPSPAGQRLLLQPDPAPRHPTPDARRGRARRHRGRGQAGAVRVHRRGAAGLVLLGDTRRGVRGSEWATSSTATWAGCRRTRTWRAERRWGTVLVEAGRGGLLGGLARPVGRRAGRRAGRVLPGAGRRGGGRADR